MTPTLGAVVAASLVTAALAMVVTALVARRRGTVSVVDITWGLVFEALLAAAPPGRRFGYAVRKVFVVQGLAAWFVSLPLQVAASTDRPLGWIAAAGVVVWVVGVGFEGVGDAQLAGFKRDPANRGGVLDRGLWGWTRHPNYFGDAAVWWGLWLVAAEAWPGVLTVLSPVVMTYFLAFATGARLLETQMAKRRGYPEYMERTSMFFPRPPRRG